MSFDAEVSSACNWLATALLPAGSPHSADFIASVKAELKHRYAGHWYPEEAHRGCAYRSLTCNGDLDPLLVRALAEKGIARDHLLQKTFILWVNPGEVKVNNAGVKSHIYCSGSKPNPYSKPKVLLEPTKLNVCTTEDGRVRNGSSSENSSGSRSPKLSPSGSPKLSANAVNFVPRSTGQSSQSSDTSDSEGELEAPYVQPHASTFAPPPGLFVPSWHVVPQARMAPQGWQPAPHSQYVVEAH